MESIWLFIQYMYIAGMFCIFYLLLKFSIHSVKKRKEEAPFMKARGAAEAQLALLCRLCSG